MPYIGKQLSNGNYLKLDDISSQFNGSKVTFSLTNGGSAYYPGSELSILVSVGGVIQEPESAYQISNDEITFANAPTAQDSFFCVVLGDAIGINVPGNNTVNGTQMAKPFSYDGGLLYLDDTNNKVGINSTSPSVALDIIGDLNVSGTITGIVTSGGSGISTFYNLNVENNATIDGNLTVNGTTTTLDTVLTEVDKLEVAANNSTVGVAITQSGSGDIFNLYDGSTEVFSVADGGAITATGAITANNFVGGLPITNGADNRVITASSASAIQGESSLTYDALELHVNNASPKLKLTDTDNSGVVHLKNVGGVGILTTTDATIFETAGTERLRITTAGNVGIGTNNPTIKLTTSTTHSNSAVADALRLTTTGTYSSGNSSDAGPAISFGQFHNNYPTWKTAQIAGIRKGNNWHGNLVFYTNDGGSETDISEKLRIDSNGFVGIKTATVNAPFHVFDATNNTVARLESGDATCRLHLKDSAGEVFVVASGDNLTLANTSSITERLTITSGGSLQVKGDANPNAVFDRGSANTTNVNFNYNGTLTGQLGAADEEFQISAAGSSTPLVAYVNGSDRLQIDTSGNILPGDAGTQELGSATKEWSYLYFANGKGLKLGSGQVGDLYNDGTDTYFRNSVSNGQTLIRSGGNIWISDYAGNHRAAFKDNSSVDLYFDVENHATAKLSTTATGISVHGEVAASQDYPNQRPTLDFNFIRTKTLDSIFTYQRMGSASFVNEQGLVELVGDNTPRFDHDPVTRECKGLLIEESRSNLIYPSSDWSGDYWTINNSGSLSRETHTDDTKDPAGTYTATKLVTLASNTNTKDIWWTKSNITYTNAVKFSVSCFAKSTTGLHLQLRPRGQSSNRAWATYNLTTGVVGNSGGTTLVSTKIEKYPNGWYRCSLVFTGSGDSSCSLGTLIMDDGNDAEAVAHTGDDSKSIYLWGAQIEQSNITTSYIPTVHHHYDISQTKTRGEDDLRIHGTDFTDFYNPLESTVCASFTHLDTATAANLGTNARVYRFRSSNTTSDTRIDYLSHTVYHPFLSEDGNQPAGGTGLDAGTPLYEGQLNKTAIKVKENDFGSCINGGSVAVDTNGDWNPTNAFDEVSLGSSNGAANTLLMGHMQRFTYYPVALPDNQLKTLTS